MDVVVPKVGLTVEFVEILEWHKAAGDAVLAGEPLVDLAADKADLSVDAPADGTLTEILAEIGAEVTPGQVIARIGDSAEGAAAPTAAEPREDDAAAPAPAPAPAPGGASGKSVPASPVARRAADALGVDVGAVGGSGAGGKVMKRDVELAVTAAPGDFAGGSRPSSPAARRLALELGVELERADGTGPGGRIVEADVRRAEAAPAPALVAGPDTAAGAPATAALDVGEVTPVRWSAARKLTARRMAAATASVAPVTLHRRADAAPAFAAAAALKEAGVKATFTHVLLAATAATLAEHPAVNSVWDGERLVRCSSVHLGLAVDVEDGLFVPVIRDADGLGVADLAQIAGGLVAQCRTGTIAPESLRGSTFSVSNLGMLGVEQFTPIVNPPHVAILGVGAVVDETRPGRHGLQFRRSCHLSLTFDHRAIDGAPAARFLDALVTRLEQPAEVSAAA